MAQGLKIWVGKYLVMLPGGAFYSTKIWWAYAHAHPPSAIPEVLTFQHKNTRNNQQYTQEQ